MIDDGHLFLVTSAVEAAALIETFLADDATEHGAEPPPSPSDSTDQPRRRPPTAREHKRQIVTEETMVQGIQSYIDMLRKFGSEIGLPKLDVDKLIDVQRKNIDALERSAKAAAEGAQSVAQKQREVLEAGLREASTLARGFQPLGNLQENLARQSEFVKKVFEIAVKGAQDSAQVLAAIDESRGQHHPGSAEEGFEELLRRRQPDGLATQAISRRPNERVPAANRRSASARKEAPDNHKQNHGGTVMAETVYKVVELIGTSTESWEKAAAAAVEKAAKSLRDLRVAEISQLDMSIDNGKVELYRAKVGSRSNMRRKTD